MAGVLWAWYRRPTLLAAALLADAQSGSGELLSSALTADDAAPFAPSLKACANAFCRQRSPRRIRVSRQGSRRWGLSLLSAALLATLSALSPPQGASRSPVTLAGAMGPSSAAAEQSPPILASESRPILPSDPDDLNASSITRDSAPTANVPQAASSGESDRSMRDAAPQASGGKAMGETQRHEPANRTADRATPPAAARDNANGVRETGGGGVGADGSHLPNAAGAEAAGAATAADRAAATPPWTSSGWPAQVARARRALAGRGVPADYRELVRQYFTTDAVSAP